MKNSTVDLASWNTSLCSTDCVDYLFKFSHSPHTCPFLCLRSNLLLVTALSNLCSLFLWISRIKIGIAMWNWQFMASEPKQRHESYPKGRKKRSSSTFLNPRCVWQHSGASLFGILWVYAVIAFLVSGSSEICYWCHHSQRWFEGQGQFSNCHWHKETIILSESLNSWHKIFDVFITCASLAK